MDRQIKMKESKVKAEEEVEEEVVVEWEKGRRSVLSLACLVYIYIFSELGLSALCPGFITASFQKMERFPGCCQICAQQHFVFWGCLFSFCPKYFFLQLTDKRWWFSFWDCCAGEGGRWRKSKRRKNEPAQAQDKTRQRERILSFSFFWPWRGL